jgi:hypothetical protein
MWGAPMTPTFYCETAAACKQADLNDPDVYANWQCIVLQVLEYNVALCCACDALVRDMVARRERAHRTGSGWVVDA